MTLPVTRREFLAALGGGVASAGLLWGLWQSTVWPRPPADRYPVPECCRYVYYEGWMLTKPDKDRLMAQGGVTPPE